jgi:plastocyanin
MKHIRLASLLTCLLALVGCGGSSPSPMSTTPTPTPTSGSPVSVGIPMGAQFLTPTATYVPDTLSVKVGTTVKWTNNDIVAHTATSSNNLWDTGNIPAGATGSYTFQSAGTFPYYCIYHLGMVGTITVQ